MINNYFLFPQFRQSELFPGLESYQSQPNIPSNVFMTNNRNDNGNLKIVITLTSWIHLTMDNSLLIATARCWASIWGISFWITWSVIPWGNWWHKSIILGTKTLMTLFMFLVIFKRQWGKVLVKQFEIVSFFTFGFLWWFWIKACKMFIIT